MTDHPDQSTAGSGPIDFSGMDMCTPLSAATAYLRASLVPIKIAHREKNPNRKRWQHERYTETELAAQFGKGPVNLGILTGAPSRGLIDADLDCLEAVRIAGHFLPETGAVFGRAGKPASHWLYTSDGPSPKSVKYTDIDDKTCLCEERSTNIQTVFPPSAHKDTGEIIRFEKQGVAPLIDPQDLHRRMGRLAAACILARHWKEGCRQDAALAVAGMLLRAGWSEPEAETFLRAVAVAAGDEQGDDRVKTVAYTAAKLGKGEAVTGWPKLAELLGEEVAKRAANWVGIGKGSRRDPRPTVTCPYVNSPEGLFLLSFDRNGNPQKVQLTNFDARVISDITHDDGAETVRSVELLTILHGREKRVTLPAREFTSMNWPVHELGPTAIVWPGMGAKDHARAAVQHLSGEDIPARTVFTHTGWRKIEGIGHVFLHAGGATGPNGPVPGTETRLEGALALFNLPEPPAGEALTTAVQASLRLLDLAPDRISVPAYASIYRAILGGADMSVFTDGATGAFKSEHAALHQQHFGAGMDRLHLPASWSSTDNALEDLVFRAKDVLLVIDDFKPSGNVHEDGRLHARADRVFRGSGNAAGRQRMRQDTSLRPPRPPRGLVFATGEELPRGHSLRARLIAGTLREGDINPKKLSACQRDAAAGLYAQATAAFIQWMAVRYEQVQSRFRQRTLELRDRMSGAHRRTPASLAGFLAALEIFVEFAVEATSENALTKAEGEALVERCGRALVEVGKTQAHVQEEADPVERFFPLLKAAISSGEVHLADCDGGHPKPPEAWGWQAVQAGARAEWRPRGALIGWVDDEYVYLDPIAAYVAAQSIAPAGEGVGIGERTLRKRLDERGLLLMKESGRDRLTVRVTLQGKRREVLAIGLSLLYEPAQSAQPAQEGFP